MSWTEADSFSRSLYMNNVELSIRLDPGLQGLEELLLKWCESDSRSNFNDFIWAFSDDRKVLITLETHTQSWMCEVETAQRHVKVLPASLHLVCLDKDVITHLRFWGVTWKHSEHISSSVNSWHRTLNPCTDLPACSQRRRARSLLTLYLKCYLWCPLGKPRLALHFTVNDLQGCREESSGRHQHYRTDM